MDDPHSNPIYKFVPPYLVICLAITIVLHLYFPIRQIIPSPWRYAGILVIAYGLPIGLWGEMLFRKRKTTLRPDKTPSALVTDGPFCFSRNPMYVCLMLALCGTAILLGSVTAFVGPVVFFAILNTICIPFEEKVMLTRFGDEYAAYKHRVRRWF